MRTRFGLAPMSASMWVMTLVCLAIPVVMYVAGSAARVPVRPILTGVSWIVVATYAFVGLWLRPIAFTIDPDGLVLEWPVRSRRIPTDAIVRARVLSARELRAELGTMMRIGAGGLWGGFGLARTAKGTLELWVSRTDRIVYVECQGRRSLLVTPRDPERFVADLQSRSR